MSRSWARVSPDWFGVGVAARWLTGFDGGKLSRRNDRRQKGHIEKDAEGLGCFCLFATVVCYMHAVAHLAAVIPFAGSAR